MPDDVMVHEIDRDGAVPRPRRGSRGRPGRAASAGGLLGGGGRWRQQCRSRSRPARAGCRRATWKILNYALTLEYLEAAFYAEANEKAS
jgi:hypothetical protein